MSKDLENKTHIFATKADMKEEMATVKEDIAKLDAKISETKYELLKWMFIFCVGSYWANIILSYLKK